MLTVYLCGPIFGMNDYGCSSWREKATAALDGVCHVLNPMRRDFRGREAEHVAEIVTGDRADIRASDVLLVNADRGASWGTAREIEYAAQLGKRIIVIHWRDNPSPWLRADTEIVPTLAEACALIRGAA